MVFILVLLMTMNRETIITTVNGSYINRAECDAAGQSWAKEASRKQLRDPQFVCFETERRLVN